MARCSGSHLSSQHFGRPRHVDHLRSGVQVQPDQQGNTPSLLKKNTKISWVLWQMPVIPATWEAEAGELLEPGDGGCSEPRLHYCTPAWVTEWDCLKKNKPEMHFLIVLRARSPRPRCWQVHFLRASPLACRGLSSCISTWSLICTCLCAKILYTIFKNTLAGCGGSRL